MKDDFDEDEATTLVSHMDKSGNWIIGNGYSNHMNGYKCKFNSLMHYDGNSVRFGNGALYLIKGKGSIKLIDKIMCYNSYYVEALNYTLLSMS